MYIEIEGKSVLFIHIPKTGGSAIEECLRGNPDETLSWPTFDKDLLWGSFRGFPAQHWSVEQSLAYLNKKIDELDYVFTIVRNPYDRFMSEFNWKLKNNSTQAPDELLRNIREFSHDKNSNFDGHLYQQNHFFKKYENKIKIFRYEDGLQSIMNQVSEDLMLVGKLLVKKVDPDAQGTEPNLKNHEDMRVKNLLKDDFFTNEMCEQIRYTFLEDFEILNYNMAASSSRRNIFCYWDSGEKNMSKFIKRIYEINKQRCDSYCINLHLITKDNVKCYVTELDDIFFSLTPNHQSDVVRWHVLNDNGGLWVDGDILLLKDVTELFKKLEEGEHQSMLNIEFNFADLREASAMNQDLVIDATQMSGVRCNYFKLANCVVFANPRTKCMEWCVAELKRLLNDLKNELGSPWKGGIISEEKFPWISIGPAIATEMYKKFPDQVKVLGDGEEDPRGWNFISYKNDKTKDINDISNSPGVTRDMWYRNQTLSAKTIASEMCRNENCYYIPTWTLHRISNLSPDELCNLVLEDKHSVFSYLV
jgi:hypothetical protein